MNQENKPINSHIEEYLDYYCNLSHAPGFAVLLKGEWGCGKTWFINEYRRKKLKKNQQKCLYVSLYGMTSFSEIEYAFFQQLHPILSSKGMAIATKIAQGFLKGALKIDWNHDSKDDGTLTVGIPDINLPEYLKNTDKSILIFDDLERCQINISNLLGYINYFVEHDDLKVIIVAHEDELIKADTSNYSSSISYSTIKEKLIGKTFAISRDLEGALESFINIVDNSDIKQFLSKNTELIEKLYHQAKFDNLRCLKQIILDFERIFQVLPDKAKNKSELLQDILKVLIAFSVEIKRGNMLPVEISQLENEHRSLYIKKLSSHKEYDETTKQNNEEETKFAQILDIYPELHLYEPFLGKLWWQTFFDQGILDTKELEQSLANSKYFQDENTPNWVRLYHFFYIDDEEFEDLLKTVESEYAARQFESLGVIKHITGLFLHFSNVGLYDKSKEDILKDSKLYIDYLKEKKILVPSKNLGAYNDTLLGQSYDGLSFQGREIEEFREFCAYIAQVGNPENVENMTYAAQNLLFLMQDDVHNFYDMICLSNSPEQTYYDIPILKYIKPSVFVEKLVLMEFDNKKLVYYALKERYKFDDLNEKLLEELVWLKEVEKLLLNEISAKEGKVSGYALKMLNEHYLNPVIQKLETKKTSVQPNIV